MLSAHMWRRSPNLFEDVSENYRTRAFARGMTSTPASSAFSKQQIFDWHVSCCRQDPSAASPAFDHGTRAVHSPSNQWAQLGVWSVLCKCLISACVAPGPLGPQTNVSFTKSTCTHWAWRWTQQPGLGVARSASCHLKLWARGHQWERPMPSTSGSDLAEDLFCDDSCCAACHFDQLISLQWV